MMYRAPKICPLASFCPAFPVFFLFFLIGQNITLIRQWRLGPFSAFELIGTMIASKAFANAPLPYIKNFGVWGAFMILFMIGQLVHIPLYFGLGIETPVTIWLFK